MDLNLLPDDERQALLAAYLEGTLDDDRAREVTAWLDRHPAALREIEHQRRLWELLGRYPDEPVPAGFSQRVLDAAGATRVVTHTPAPRRSLRGWALAAAAAALVAVGATVLLRARPVVEPQPDALSIAGIDLDLVQHANLEGLLTLSDDEFEALLADDPDLLANAGLGG
jgi:anti-sigma factor RsiW